MNPSNTPLIADPWRLQIALLPVRYKSPDDLRDDRKARQTAKGRAVAVRNTKARRADNVARIKKLIVARPMRQTEIVQITHLSTETVRTILVELREEGYAEKTMIDNLIHWRSAT